MNIFQKMKSVKWLWIQVVMDKRGRLLEALFIFPVSFIYTCIRCLIDQKHLKVFEILMHENKHHVHLQKFIF